MKPIIALILCLKLSVSLSMGGLGKVSSLLKAREYDKSLIILDAILDSSKSQNGVSSPKHREVQIKLGDEYYKYGYLSKASDLYWNGALITRELNGEENTQYIDDVNRVAHIYELKGNYLTAKKMYERSYAIAKKVEGKESIIYAAQLDNLGRLSEIHDEYAAAENYYINSSSILIQRGEEASLVYAHNLADQAHLYYLLGSYTASEALFRQSKYIYESHNYTEDAEYAYTLRFLAQLDIRLNNTIEAVLLLNDALDIYANVYLSLIHI